MNCQVVRNRILAEEELARLPDELATHLDGCSACRSWRRTFLLVDQALGGLPVPEADGRGKRAVLDHIRTTSTDRPTLTEDFETVLNHKPMPVALEKDLPQKKRRSFGKHAARFWPAGLVAATLLIGTVAWLNLPSDPEQPARAPADPMLDNLVKLNVELAKTQNPADRVTILTRIAEELNQEMRDIARADATGTEMEALKQMYKTVVEIGLITQANLVDKSQRDAVLGKAAESLAQAGQKADQMAAESPQHSADHLRGAADIARKGTIRIRNLIREAQS